MKHVSLSVEAGRRHHVMKQGWVYAMSTVILQCENSGKEGTFGETDNVWGIHVHMAHNTHVLTVSEIHITGCVPGDQSFHFQEP